MSERGDRDDIHEDHARFRELVQRSVMNLVKSGIRDDPLIQMYESESNFAAEWSDGLQRKQMLDELEEQTKNLARGWSRFRRDIPRFFARSFLASKAAQAKGRDR